MGLLIELGMRASEWRLGASFVDAKVMILGGIRVVCAVRLSKNGTSRVGNR
jgi:hypothetical protein